MGFDPAQITAVLDRLPGWQVEDGALVRGVPVTASTRSELVAAIGHVSAGFPTRPALQLQPDLVVLKVGEPGGHGVTPQDVLLATTIDQVLRGSLVTAGVGVG